MGIEIISNVGTAYKDVPRVIEKYSNDEAVNEFDIPQGSQEISKNETKPIAQFDNSGKEKALKDDQEMTAYEYSQTLQHAVENANKKLKALKTNCEFKYHEETNRICIKVKNEDTGEVIREIPPEETLDMIGKMWDLMGLFIDKRG